MGHYGTMRNAERGIATLVVLGSILALLGIVAIAIAPSIMNQAEIGTLRYIGGGMAAVGVLLAIVGMNKKA